MSDVAQLHTHFQNLGLPDAATSWLLEVWRCIQLFDDVADGGKVERADLDGVLWSVFVSMNANQFFEANRGALVPVMATQLLKWQGSDRAERAGRADERSYMWRAGYYDLVMMVVAIVHGPVRAVELSDTVMGLYGEAFADYRGEFEHA